MKIYTIVATLLVACLAHQALAAPPHFEGFEDPTWTAGQPGNWQNYNGGDIERVPSGHAGIPSSSGIAHAIITNLSENDDVFGNPALGSLSPYTQFGGYSNSFGPGFVASLDVYLDPAWSDGQGFDYSVAANRQNGDHLRDFIWHVGVVGGDLLVNASNNSDRSFNAWKLENENSGNNHTVATAGWYTLENIFYDDGGTLSVDFNFRDGGGALLHSITRSTADGIATDVGGNRYGWLVFNNVDGLAIDNTSLAAIPEPTSLALLGMSSLALLLRRNRR